MIEILYITAISIFALSCFFTAGWLIYRQKKEPIKTTVFTSIEIAKILEVKHIKVMKVIDKIRANGASSIQLGNLCQAKPIGEYRVNIPMETAMIIASYLDKIDKFRNIKYSKETSE